MPAEETVPAEIPFRPRGRAVQIAESDSSQIDAVRDAIDNVRDAAIVNAHEGGQVPDEIEARIEYHPGTSVGEKERIVIKDNAAQGVPPLDLGEVIALGASSKGPDLIGEFGIGGLRYFALGDTVRVASNHPNYPASEITVHAPELRADDTGDDEVFRSERRDIEDLEEGWFRVTVENLKSGVDDLIQSAIDDLGDEDSYADAESALEEESLRPVARALGRTYHRYLENGINIPESDQRVPLSILLYHGQADGDGEEIPVEPEAPPDFVYLPMDGLAPRKYKGVPFATSREEDPEPEVFADIEIGLQRTKNTATAGLYLAFQDRMVYYADLNSRLFDSSYLGELNDATAETRLMIKVDLREGNIDDGNRSYLPINSAKTGFDYNNHVTNRLLTFISNAAEPYSSQTYTRLRGWLLNAYSPESNPDIDTKLLPDPFIKDKSGAKTNKAAAKPKPGFYASGRRLRDYPERDTLQTIVLMHDLLRIRVDDPTEYLKEQFNELASNGTRSNIEVVDSDKARQFAVAYHYYMDNQYPRTDGDDNPVILDTPSEITWTEGPSTVDWDWIKKERKPYDIEKKNDTPEPIEEIVELAEKQHNDGGSAGEIAPWQVPRFNEELRRLTVDVDDAVVQLGSYLDRISRGKEDDSPDTDTTDSLTEREETDTREEEDTDHRGENTDATDTESDGTTDEEEDSPERSTDEQERQTEQSKVGTEDRQQQSLSESTEEQTTQATNDESVVERDDAEPTATLPIDDDGIIIVSDGELTTLENLPSDQGFVIMDNGEPTIPDSEQFEHIQAKLTDLGFDEDDLMTNVEAALDRLEQLEQAASIFKEAD